MSKVMGRTGQAKAGVSVSVECFSLGESVHLLVLGRSGRLHERLNTLYSFGGTFNNMLYFSINPRSGCVTQKSPMMRSINQILIPKSLEIKP